MRIIQATYENSNHTIVNATYENGENYSGITSASRFWVDVEEYLLAGGVIGEYIDPETTPEAIEARETYEREQREQKEAIEAAKVMNQIAANKGEYTDNELVQIAKAAPSYFADWAPGALKKDMRLWYDGQLVIVLQDHTATTLYPPSTDTLSLYRIIDSNPEADGTREHPYKFVVGVDAIEGNYYTYDGKLWLCKRTLIPTFEGRQPEAPGMETYWEEIE